MIYLDYNATAPLRPEVIARMNELLAIPSNPSSAHRFGRDAKKHLEDARKIIADALSAWPNEIIFCGSGTEANAMALRGFSERRILVSAVEHSSVLSTFSQWERGGASRGEGPHPNLLPQGEGIIPVDLQGIVDLAALEKLLSEETPTLVSVMLANNETGVIQPIAEVAALCKRHDTLLHCDAVQGMGKIAVDFGALGVDLMTISGHKCGGPVGAAALVVRRDLPVAALLTGGGQELGRRAGTENVAAIAGFARAMELVDFEHMKQLRGWLDTMESVILNAVKDLKKDPSAVHQDDHIIFGASALRLPNTSCLAMPGVGNEVQLMDFDLNGFAVSAGSACSSGRIEVSHVLMAMGVPKTLAASAIRVSGGWQTTEKEIRLFTEAWLKTCLRLGKL